MPEIAFKDLKSQQQLDKKPVYLIYGEEALVRLALDRVLATLNIADINHERIENDDVSDAMTRVNTFSLLAEPKVVGLYDSRIFFSKSSPAALLEKAKDAFDGEKEDAAAKWMATLLGTLDLTFDDVKDPQRRETALNLNAEVYGDGEWVATVLSRCETKNLTPRTIPDAAAALRDAIEKGFPAGHALVITAEGADKKHGLYDIIRDKGLVIDCSVPKGSRKVDQETRDALLRDRMTELLGRAGKRMEPRAYAAMVEMTGFDVRTFSGNLEKLIQYVGERPMITAADVGEVLDRTRKDPIYEMTEAVTDRKLGNALFYVSSLLGDGFFPLQILAALINQVRRLMVARDFMESPEGRAWAPGMGYPQFQNVVMPQAKAYDQRRIDMLTAWQEALRPPDQKKKGKPKKTDTDLVLTKASRSPFPVFRLLQKASVFDKEELTNALDALHEADLKLKSAGTDHRLVLEWAVTRICMGRRGPM